MLLELRTLLRGSKMPWASLYRLLCWAYFGSTRTRHVATQTGFNSADVDVGMLTCRQRPCQGWTGRWQRK